MKVKKCFLPYAATLLRKDGNIHIPRKLIRNLEVALAAAAGREPENNLAFEVEDNFGNTYYFWFHDILHFIGQKIMINDPARVITLDSPKEIGG